MQCSEARRLLEQGILPGSADAQRATLGFHLAQCTSCRDYRAQLDMQRLLATLLAQPTLSVVLATRTPQVATPSARPTPRRMGRAGVALLVAGALAAIPISQSMPVRAANSQTPRALVQAKSNVTQTNALATKPQAESLPRFVVALPAVYNQEAPKHTAAVEESDVLVDRRAALPLADVVAAVEEISVPANVHALAWSSGADVARSQLTAFALAPEQQLQLIEAAATIDESIADVSLEVGQTLLMPLQQGPEPPQPIAVPVTQPQPQPATQQPATGTPQGQRYVVRRNDTLRTIAREFYKDERRWRAIYDANREVIGRNPDLIYPNQRLIIPSAAPIGGKPNPSQPSQGQRTYVVRSGDTLSTIALRYYGNGNLWPLVYEANRRTIGGNPDVIRPQQQLTIPQRTSGQPQPQPQPGKRTYTVKRGDSLREIAQQFYGNELRWQEIYRANRQLIPDPDRLRIGIQLAIP